MVSAYNIFKTGALPAVNALHPRAILRPEEVYKITGEGPDGNRLSGAGTLRGSDEAGRPVREFAVAGAPTSPEAARAAAAIRWQAGLLRQRGLLTAAPAMVAGPAAALARGEAIVLRFTNGATITAAL